MCKGNFHVYIGECVFSFFPYICMLINTQLKNACIFTKYLFYDKLSTILSFWKKTTFLFIRAVGKYHLCGVLQYIRKKYGPVIRFFSIGSLANILAFDTSHIKMAETIQWSFTILRNNFSTSNRAKKHSSKSILHQTYSRSCITYSSKFFWIKNSILRWMK